MADRLWGGAVVGYHLLNILLHATAACLVAAIVRRLFAGEARSSPPLTASGTGAMAAGRERGPYAGVDVLAGLIFALHPVCVESVAWISEQKICITSGGVRRA